jgi:hypothetical protein
MILVICYLQDFSSSGFTNWPFMTTHCWGENPIGTGSFKKNKLKLILIVLNLFKSSTIVFILRHHT